MHVKSRYIWSGIFAAGVILFALLGSRALVADAALQVGNQFFGGGMPYNLNVADMSYRTALLLDPNVEDAWHQRARIAFLRGDFKLATTMINTQIELHGDTFMASYYIRGLIAGYAGRYGDAEKDFSKFLEWSPTNWAAANDLAWIYFSQGKFKEAAHWTAQSLKFSPYNPWLLLTNGMSEYNLGNKEKAKEQLVKAKEAAATLTPANWSRSYPGNDPRIALEGLAQFRATIDKNLELVNK